MKKISADQLEQLLRQANMTFGSREISSGTQFSFDDGAKLNVYTTKKRTWCGDMSGDTKVQVESLIDGESVPLPSVVAESNQNGRHEKSNKVFIVYGHDSQARDSLELMLRRFRLEPIILENQTSGGKTIIEKLDNAARDVHYAIVLLTPDDVGAAKCEETTPRPRARQNVVLELGMFLAKLGRERVAILYHDGVERPSDIDGLVYIPFFDAVEAVQNKLAGELQEAGFTINIKDMVN